MPSTKKERSKYISKKNFVSSIAKWAVFQSPYSHPENLDRVLIKADGHWPNDGDVHGDHSYFKEWVYEDFYQYVKDFVFNTPEVLAWNNSRSPSPQIIFVSSMMQAPHPDENFIDLDALVRNIFRECWTD